MLWALGLDGAGWYGWGGSAVGDQVPSQWTHAAAAGGRPGIVGAEPGGSSARVPGGEPRGGPVPAGLPPHASRHGGVSDGRHASRRSRAALCQAIDAPAANREGG